jgi:hypothetical protein
MGLPFVYLGGRIRDGTKTGQIAQVGPRGGGGMRELTSCRWASPRQAKCRERELD